VLRLMPAGYPMTPPAATPFFTRDGFVLNWSIMGSTCMRDRLTGSYASVRDLLKPEMAALLPKA
jgi:hypothetical protein